MLFDIIAKMFKHIIRIYREKRGPFSKGHDTKVSRLGDDLGESETIQFPDRFEGYIAGFRVKGKNHQANRFIEIARAAFQTCIDLKIFKDNPVTAERFPFSEEIARDNYLPPEEIRKVILTAAKNRRTSHIARALQYYFTVPCRRGEVIRMRVADVDLFGKKIRVHNGTTKNDVGTWKPIPPQMLHWFMRRLRDAKNRDESVFGRYVSAHGKFIPLGDFKHAWDTVRKKVGHPDLRIHDSRHISATDLVNGGTPRTVVNAVAGWRTDMLKSYYHLDADAALNHIQWPGIVKREASVKPF